MRRLRRLNRLNRIRNAVEENRDFDRAREILSDAQSSYARDIAFTPHENQLDQDEDKSNISRDFGSGRASKGMRFLELISFMFLGKEADSVLRFDTIPNYVNHREFFAATLTNEQKVNIIAKSLGVDEFVTIIRLHNLPIMNTVNTRFVEVFDIVTDGSFRVVDNKSLRSFARTIAKSAINRGIDYDV